MLASERAPGDEVGGYRIIRALGRGGSGTVYLVEDHGGGQAALKLVDTADAGARTRLAREVAALQALRHPAVPRVLDAELDDAQPFVVSEFVEGPSLAAYVARRGALGPDAVAGIAQTLGSALAAVHAAGVVHRDVTPSNVLLSPEGPVLIDFGISHGVEDDRLTRVGLVSGTAGYVAPEVIDGAEPTPASDDWALVATLAFAATGAAPFGTGAGALRATLDGAVHADVPVALARALTSAPQFRPSLDQLIAALREGGAGAVGVEPVPATRVMPVGGDVWTDVDGYSAEDLTWVDSGTGDFGLDFQVEGEIEPGVWPAVPRRRTVLVAWSLAMVALATIAPGVAAVLLLVLVVAARAVEYAARGVHRSRARRGAETGGVGPQLLASPWHVLRGLVTGSPSLVLAALVAGGVGALGWWVTSGLADHTLWRVGVLAVAAAGAVAVLAWGPGALITRDGANRVAAAFAPSRAWSGGWVALAAVVILASAGMSLAGIPPLEWPLPTGTLHPGTP